MYEADVFNARLRDGVLGDEFSGAGAPGGHGGHCDDRVKFRTDVLFADAVDDVADADPPVRAAALAGKLVEWVLNITQARWEAYRAGEPDPYNLPMPANLSLMSGARGRVEEHKEPELLHRRKSTA